MNSQQQPIQGADREVPAYVLMYQAMQEAQIKLPSNPAKPEPCQDDPKPLARP